MWETITIFSVVPILGGLVAFSSKPSHQGFISLLSTKQVSFDSKFLYSLTMPILIMFMFFLNVWQSSQND